MSSIPKTARNRPVDGKTIAPSICIYSYAADSSSILMYPLRPNGVVVQTNCMFDVCYTPVNGNQGVTLGLLGTVANKSG